MPPPTIPLCLDIADLLAQLDELFVGGATLTLLILLIIILVPLHISVFRV